MIGTSGVEKNDTLGLLLNGSLPGGGNLSAALPGPGTEPPTLPPYIRTTSMLLCIFILGIGVIGNVMVPLVILKTKDMRNSTNIFLMNLSLADLMVLLVCTPTVLVEVNSKPETWVLGEHMYSLESLGFHVVKDSLYASKAMQAPVVTSISDPGENKVHVKCLAKDRKKPLDYYLNPRENLQILFETLAKDMDVHMKSLKVKFDEDTVHSKDTPQSLDLDGGECFHVFISK